jgi:hypothetical protein
MSGGEGEIKYVTLNVNVNTDKTLKDNNNVQKDKPNRTKRVVAEQWTFDESCYTHEKQLDMIRAIQANGYQSIDPVSKIAVQQIQKKVSGYKQQDLLKKKYQGDRFLHLQSIVDQMVECELKCYYCLNNMDVLYDITRESTQWSVDRIDNDKGHNLGNFYLACLECNLKRRCRNDAKFLFTKQLKLVKMDT